MRISPNTVVSIDYELFDSAGDLIEKSQAPIAYLHGGYGAMFPLVEESLTGCVEGEKVEVSLEPEEAFGDYDEELVRIEARASFPPELEVGMQFEGRADGSDHGRVFTVTDVTEEKVVVDGNHPLAGRSVVFACTVASVRPATPEEIQHRHAHGAGGHHHH
ncbi:MAG: peptidylprolyl isomerase [Burkholderiales bacterium]|nr:peptidylprolyl isomerase [Burkholderiales bacterium]